MTVGELIEELKKYPNDTLIKIRGYDFTDFSNNEEVIPILYLPQYKKVTLG